MTRRGNKKLKTIYRKRDGKHENIWFDRNFRNSVKAIGMANFGIFQRIYRKIQKKSTEKTGYLQKARVSKNLQISNKKYTR